MRLKVLLPLLPVLFTCPSFSQLSGTYTVGGAGAVFTSPQDAADSLMQVGLSGNVTFLVNPGNYSGFWLNGVNPTAPGIRVRFVSADSLNNMAVIGGATRLESATGIDLAWLRFHTMPNQNISCVKCSSCTKILISHCRITKDFPGLFQYEEALLSLDFPYSGPELTVNIEHSVLSADQGTFWTSGPAGKVVFSGDSISGSWSSLNSGGKLVWTGNTFDINPGYYNIANQSFYSNSFSSTGLLHIQGNFFGNQFYCESSLYGSNIYSNHFFSKFSSTLSGPCVIADNIFDAEFEMTYSDNSLICRNRFYGECTLTSQGLRIHSNFFYANVSCTHNPQYIVRYNNFGPGTTFSMYYTGGILENNNFWDMFILNYGTTSIRNNNFIPHPGASVNNYGINPRSYDPLYVSPNDLHATNPSLTGKSLPWSDYTYKYDIDSTVRKLRSTIGANEICSSFIHDTIIQSCDSTCLSTCLSSFGGYYWSPSYLFTDTASPNPTVHPASSCMVRLNQTGTGPVDSVFIAVSDLPPVASASVYKTFNTVYFTSTSSCADSVSWDFGDGTRSAGPYVTHLYPSAGFYTAKLRVYSSAGSDSLAIPLLLHCLMGSYLVLCGDSLVLDPCIPDFTGFYWTPSFLFRDSTEAKPKISPDSIIVVSLRHTGTEEVAQTLLFTVPSVPSLSAVYQTDSLQVTFTSTSRCADSLWWDFGDGTGTSVRNPVHSYPHYGPFNVRLSGYSIAGGDTVFIPLILDGIPREDSRSFSIFPDPADDFVFIVTADEGSPFEVSLLDLQGRKVLGPLNCKGRTRLRVSSLSPGMYIVSVSSRNTVYSQKLFIRH